MPNMDLTNIDTISKQHLHVLLSIETGMKTHEYVPLPVIKQISNSPSTEFILKDLHRLKLIKCYNHVNYTLTYLGHDYIALTSLKNKQVFDIIGTRIGVGKEADVYIARNANNNQLLAVKFHKLGLTSFQTAKTKRNYLGRRVNASWIKMSELSAKREYGYLKVLSERGFPCPQAVALNRQCVVMTYIDGVKMNKLTSMTPQQANELGWQVWTKQMTLLSYGVIHGDLNEYNVILKLKQQSNEIVQSAEEEIEEVEYASSIQPQKEYTLEQVKELYDTYSNKELSFAQLFVIDFPQMINSTDSQAEMQFDRDCNSYENFLNRRFQAGLQLPRFKYVKDLYKIKPEEKIDTSEKAVNQYCTDVTKQQVKKTNVYQRVLLEKNQKNKKEQAKQFKEKKRNYQKVKDTNDDF